MARPCALGLVDHGLVGLAGHNLTYAQRVLTAAADMQLRTVVGVSRAATDLSLGAETLRLFGQDVWANNPSEGRLWHTSALMARRLRRGPPPRATSAEPRAPEQPIPPPPGRRERLHRLLDGVREDAWAVASPARSTAAFARELCAFLDAARLQPGDIVYLPTALATELQGVDLLLARSPAARRIRWRILMRYAPESALVRRSLVRAARRLHRRADVDLRLFSDTEALCRFYEALCDVRVGLLPIPVSQAPKTRTPPAGPLTVAYLGDARDEKGFHHLPEIISRLRRTEGSAKLRFLVQANLNTPAGDPLSRPARDQLERMAGPDLELVKGPLTPEAYDRLLAAADVLLLPYRPSQYVERSSGVLMEALIEGVPCVTTRGAWTADVLRDAAPPAGLAASDDAESLAGALETVIADWPRYAEGAHRLAQRLRPRTDPAELVRLLDA